jgi:hypothetical protein
MIEIIDALRLLLIEAVQTVDPNARADDSAADPVAWSGSTLYVYEADTGDIHQPEGDGSLDTEIFTVQATYIAEASAEAKMGARTRPVSVQLDAVKEAMLSTVRANRTLGALDVESGATVQLWADLRGSADMGFIRAIRQRGVAVNISGSRQIPGLN